MKARILIQNTRIDVPPYQEFSIVETKREKQVIPVSIDRVVVFPAPFVPKNPKHSPS